MKKSDFYFDLPERLIAQHPLEQRDASRLMVLDRRDGSVTHRHFRDLLEYVQPGDCMVFNNSRVIPARLMGHAVGHVTPIEVLLLTDKGDGLWECLTRPGKKTRTGVELTFGDGLLTATVEAVQPDGNRLIRFHYEGIFMEILDKLGTMPLPPYIKEKLDDPERYQTVYSKTPGSAAAPTAGPHVTTELLDALKAKGVTLAFVTLHVGLGTFRPVKEDEITDHIMHSEYYIMDEETAGIINDTRAAGGKIWAVGTTATRTLETIAADDGTVRAQSGWTDIFIYPGYKFKAVDHLVTNFHLPESTLMMLISAFATREMVMNVKTGTHKGHRFFSLKRFDVLNIAGIRGNYEIGNLTQLNRGSCLPRRVLCTCTWRGADAGIPECRRQRCDHGAVDAFDLTRSHATELSNTYHLYVRPGDQIVKQMGVLHKFMRWDGPMLTDSGFSGIFAGDPARSRWRKA